MHHETVVEISLSAFNSSHKTEIEHDNQNLYVVFKQFSLPADNYGREWPRPFPNFKARQTIPKTFAKRHQNYILYLASINLHGFL